MPPLYISIAGKIVSFTPKTALFITQVTIIKPLPSSIFKKFICIQGSSMKKKNNQTSNSSSKKKKSNKLVLTLCTALAIISGGGTLIHNASSSPTDTPTNIPVQTTVNEPVTTKPQQASSQYTTKDEVARYICDNDRLPPNYVNKEEAMRLYEENQSREKSSHLRQKLHYLSHK